LNGEYCPIHCRLDHPGRPGRRQDHWLPNHSPIRLFPRWSWFWFRSRRGRAPKLGSQEFESQSPGPYRKESERMEGSRVRGCPRCCRRTSLVWLR
jgi:hypothetical protein